MKTYLQVPFAQKDQAKAMGARWDEARKQWYCPDGIDLAHFKQWLPSGNRVKKKSAGARLRAGTAELREPRAPVPHYAPPPAAPKPPERDRADQALRRIRELLKK